MEMKQSSFDGRVDTINQLKTGTTTIGIIYKDGVIIGTESQATAGTFVASRTAQKLFKINKFAAATISGGVADCQYLVNQITALSNLEQVEKESVPRIKWVANSLKNILYQGRSAFVAMMIIGGFSPEEKKGKLFGIDLLGSLFKEERFLGFGSGSPYALGVLEFDWKANMTEKKGVDLVKMALKSAVVRDSGSGYKFQIVKITKDGFTPIENFHG
jgi:proteasome beta subunit